MVNKYQLKKFYSKNKMKLTFLRKRKSFALFLYDFEQNNNRTMLMLIHVNFNQWKVQSFLQCICTFKVRIHIRKLSMKRKIFRGPHAQYDFFFRKYRTVHAVRGKFSVPWKIFWSVCTFSLSFSVVNTNFLEKKQNIQTFYFLKLTSKKCLWIFNLPFGN